MKKIVITATVCLLFVCHATVLTGQGPSFSWNVSWGNAELDFNPRLAADKDGNVYCAGYFRGSVDFDPGPGQSIFTSGSGGFGSDSYVSKFDSTGQLVWVRQIGGQSFAKAIFLDDEGRLYIGGDFLLAGDFDPGPGIFNMTPLNSSSDVYVLTLDLDGQFIDAYQIGGNGQEYFGSMSMDHNGHMLIGGLFTGTSDFDPGPGEAIFSAGLLNDLFVVKYDADVEFVWAREISGNVQGSITSIVTDSISNIYMSGVFDDIRDFDPGPDSVKLTAIGAWDLYVLKWSEDGAFQWIRHLGNVDGDNWAHDMVINDDEELYVTGHFTGTLDFDAGPGIFEMTATNSDPYLWKMDKDGNFIWSAQFKGISFDQSRDVTLDAFGNVYSTGWFGDVMDFDPGTGEYNLISAGGDDKDDGYITKLSPDGDFVWASSLGGLEDDYGRETKVDLFGHVFITGNFQGKAVFNPLPQVQDSLASNGSWDTFLVRWKQCQASYGEIFPQSCDVYTSPSGNHVWNISGEYADTLVNVAGCDSILTIQLTISSINTSVIVIPEGQLIAEMEGAMYQWVDCDDGYAPIPDETNQSFSAVTSGFYGVIINNGVCEDTSACINVNVVATDDPHTIQNFSIHPNPTSDSWYIQTGDHPKPAFVEIIDLCGQKRFVASYPDATQIHMETKLPPGIYLVSVVMHGSQQVQKLIVL